MIGRQRTRASGPICGIAAPATAAIATTSAGSAPASGQGDEPEQAEAAEQGLHEHHRPLADPVGEAARDRCAHGVRDGERAGGGTAGAVRAGGAGDEEEGAHLGHGEREAADERDGDVEGSGEGEQPPVGGEWGHRGLPGSAPG